MTTSEQQQPVDNNTNFDLESQARAFRGFRTRVAVFNGLLTRDQKERANASDRITQLLKNLARESYPSDETAGTVVPTTGDRESVSGVSSPLNNVLVTPLSSLSPFNSPLFTDGSGSASASSYAPSPNIHHTHSTEGVESENFGSNVNQMDFRNGIPDGLTSDHSRRNSADENSHDDIERSEEERKEYLRLLILAMLRMSIDCPFADVRYSFNKCLKRLRQMNVPIPSPINPSPSFFIPPQDIITLEWPIECTNSTLTERPRSVTPSGYSTSSSSSLSDSSSISEEVPRVIQQPLTPATPLYPTSPPSLPVGRQPDNIVRKLMTSTFIDLARLSHFYRILAYFPSFMEKYQVSYKVITTDPNNGSVPLSWRLYIGIMAASQFKCQYVVSKLTNEFLMYGGINDWLQGLQHAPAKIRNLATLNTILANQPWRLKPSHIGALVKRSENPQEQWSIAEIVHVILIMSTFHSLSSYALGCGIVPEYDCVGGSREQPPSIPNSPIEESGNSIGVLNPENISAEVLSGLGFTLEEESDTVSTTTESVIDPIPIPGSSNRERNDLEINHTSQLISRLNLRNKESEREEDRQINFGSVSSDDSYSFPRVPGFDNVDEETFTDETDVSAFSFPPEFFSKTNTTTRNLTYNPPPAEDFSKFLDPNVEIRYADFSINSTEYSVFKLQDYCWEDHGIVMVNNYLPNTGEILDEEFAAIREFTDYSLFHSYRSDLDTTPFRQAIWYYVQRLFGLYKDDYEYRDYNIFLNKKFKAFLKKVCCTPGEVSYNDWRDVGFRLREEEKCHVNLIAVEARKQAELVYGLSCVMKWEKGERIM